MTQHEKRKSKKKNRNNNDSNLNADRRQQQEAMYAKVNRPKSRESSRERRAKGRDSSYENKRRQDPAAMPGERPKERKSRKDPNAVIGRTGGSEMTKMRNVSGSSSRSPDKRRSKSTKKGEAKLSNSSFKHLLLCN